MVNKPIWQLQLLDYRRLPGFASDRGLRGLLPENLHLLWRLGLIRADLIEACRRLSGRAFLEVGEEEKTRIYADIREIRTRRKGLVGAAVAQQSKWSSARPLFHPFRYYVLFHLFRELDLSTPMMVVIYNQEKFLQEPERLLEYFRKRSSSPEFSRKLERCNQVAELTILSEPVSLPQIVGKRSFPAFFGESAYRKMLAEYEAEVREHYRTVGLDAVEKAREEICSVVRTLEPNVEVLRLVRIAKAELREKLKGRLGGAVLLLSAAEVLRRAAEKFFESELPEEDEVLSNWDARSFKKRMYGSDRLLNGDPRVIREYLRKLALDKSLRVRWYVEGDTEYGALQEFFGAYASTYVDLVNLSGRVREKKKKLPAFLNLLKGDIQHEVFSFVTIDADREDNVRALRKAVEHERFFGMFFLSDPDFAFHNFRLEELGRVLWKMAEERGARNHTDKLHLLKSIKSAENETQLLKEAGRALPEFLGGISKNESWGRRLMQFALKQPKTAQSQYRPIIHALREALRYCELYNYRSNKKACRVDAETGKIVRK